MEVNASYVKNLDFLLNLLSMLRHLPHTCMYVRMLK